MTAERRALLLAGLQVGDLVVTQVSPRYGADHLDHLGVPRRLRPMLPMMKTAAVVALLVTSKRARHRYVVGASLVTYYSAAVAFHALAGDTPSEIAPAAGCAVIAASLV